MDHLDERVEASESDEIGRLGTAFNSMTRVSSERSRRSLSGKRSPRWRIRLGAGARNSEPLSAIKLNLQHVKSA
jgi:hypothetical protein